MMEIIARAYRIAKIFIAMRSELHGVSGFLAVAKSSIFLSKFMPHRSDSNRIYNALSVRIDYIITFVQSSRSYTFILTITIKITIYDWDFLLSFCERASERVSESVSVCVHFSISRLNFDDWISKEKALAAAAAQRFSPLHFDSHNHLSKLYRPWTVIKVEMILFISTQSSICCIWCYISGICLANNTPICFCGSCYSLKSA